MNRLLRAVAGGECVAEHRGPERIKRTALARRAFLVLLPLYMGRTIYLAATGDSRYLSDMRRNCFIPTFVVALLSGCGTFQNVTAPATGDFGGPFGVPRDCAPLGGVQRSAARGLLGTPTSLVMAASGHPECLQYAAINAFFLIDAPFSLAGDIVTLPLVYYRLSKVGRVEESSRSDE